MKVGKLSVHPAGASNLGHDAAGRSCRKIAWKIKFFFLKLYIDIEQQYTEIKMALHPKSLPLTCFLQ